MHRYTYKILNYKPMVAEPIILIYAEIMDYRMSAPFPRQIVFVKNHREHGKSNITNLKVKPLNYCLAKQINTKSTLAGGESYTKELPPRSRSQLKEKGL